MKVLHLLNSNKFSGAENVVCQIISAFKDQHCFEMVYCSPDGPIKTVLTKKNIPYMPIEKLCKRRLKKVIREQKPDIIHAHDFRASIIAASVFKGLVIFHLHNNSPWIKKKGLYSYLFLHYAKKAALIFCVSDSIKNEYVFSKKIADKMKVIGNPFTAEKILERSKAYEFDGNFDIGFCGRLTPQKNPFMFIDIISKLKENYPDIKAVMIGDGELRKEVANYLERKNLNNNIEMFGFVNNPFPILCKCKIVMMPSVWEGFGLAAIEALSLGIPVLASPVGGLVDIVNEKNGFLCDSLESYCKEYLKLKSNLTLYLSKSEEAKKTGQAFSNVTAYCGVLKNTYEELTKE